mmetsp:Transcript_1059/g.1821  ORF Transcript_1059/g.1821 Transcript_1059/m.1821 type:complete len:454 (-) Transcript_1059:17-1378(-)|eukprot:CAMPEP_0197535540 /NCGR_PEP_ID=MMETSP1318-20131121/50936_1 /TAXON_ID=552666 /ORGANISM="Partenskyella glossopodia, Strain RCC365" /LENGTH=453 /DNA_ID=CAMNT_0043093153 /DNA_START=109 /DNA_END=1470 /DNA_ORIENTATION=+
MTDSDEKVPTKIIPAATRRSKAQAQEKGKERQPSPPQYKSPKSRSKTTKKLRKLDRISADTEAEHKLKKIDASEGAEVFCVRFSPDSKFIAAGCGDGSVRVFNAEGKMSYMLNAGPLDSLPCTAIRFRPTTTTSRSKNMLICGNANGTIEHWHMTSRKRIFKIEEKENQIYALDYSADGELFASAGKDTVVRVYEETTKSLLATLERGWSSTNADFGHSNRIYALKFHPNDKNLLVSAGWDNTVQIWDIRAKKSRGYIYGPHICGDALDLHGNMLLTGSWQSNDALQLWDLRKYEKPTKNVGPLSATFPGQDKPKPKAEPVKPLQNIAFREPMPSKDKKDFIPEMLYAAAFSPNGKLIAAGGSGGSEVRVFNVDKALANESDYSEMVVDEFNGGGAGVYSVHFSPNGRKLATGCGNDQIAVGYSPVDTWSLFGASPKSRATVATGSGAASSRS